MFGVLYALILMLIREGIMQSGIKMEEKCNWKKVYKDLHKNPACLELIRGQFGNLNLLLLKAFLKHKWKVVKTLLTKFPHDIDVNVSSAEGEYEGVTVLLYAASFNQWDIVNIILEKFSINDINRTGVNNRKGKTVLWYASFAQNWDVVNCILEKFPEVDVNIAPIEGDHRERTALNFMSKWGEWDLLLSVLRNPLIIVDVQLLFNKPRQKEISILESILARRSENEMQERVVSQILMHYILSSQCKEFKDIVNLLHKFQKTFVPEAPAKETVIIEKQIKRLIIEYRRGRMIFDTSPELYFNNVLEKGRELPIEVRCYISEFITSPYFTNDQMKRFIGIPFKKEQDADTHYHDVLEKNFGRELTNLTRKALYSWEENHLHLALFQRNLNKKAKLNLGFCLRDNLKDRLSKQINRAELIEKIKTNFNYQIIPSTLANNIIEKISHLALEDLNKLGFMKALDEVFTNKKRKAIIFNSTKNKKEQPCAKASRTKRKQSISSITAAFFKHHRPTKGTPIQTKKSRLNKRSHGENPVIS